MGAGEPAREVRQIDGWMHGGNCSAFYWTSLYSGTAAYIEGAHTADWMYQLLPLSLHQTSACFLLRSNFVFLQIHDISRFYICFYYQHISAPQIQKLALMSPKAFTCRSSLPNFKSLSCLVWSVGGSKYEKVAVGLLKGGIL